MGGRNDHCGDCERYSKCGTRRITAPIRCASVTFETCWGRGQVHGARHHILPYSSAHPRFRPTAPCIMIFCLSNSVALAVLILSQGRPAHAFWRQACSVAQESRIDPILSFGQPSGHVHKFAGGISKWNMSSVLKVRI